MDWFLSAFTVLVNAGLGWTRGKWWAWGLHAINAAVWIFYAITIKQYGLIMAAAVGIVIDLFSAEKAYKRDKVAICKWRSME